MSKQILRSVGLMLAGAAVITAVSCKKEVDAYTSATIKSGTITLPKAGDSYKVLGVIPGLQNYAVKYDSNYYRGGMFTGIEGMKQLKKHGIKTVISVTPNDLERLLAEKFDVNLIELEFDHEGVPTKILKEFLAALNDKPGPYYVHCHGGTHRAGTLSFAYRVIKQGWSYEKAEKEFIALGGHIDKDAKLIGSVKKYAEKHKTSNI